MPVPTSKRGLYEMGLRRIRKFCTANNLQTPKVVLEPKDKWEVGACAYYRPQQINICLEECAYPCTDAQGRNWNWPGNTTDREPYGVLAHELGHHADWTAGARKGKYYSEYCEQVQKDSGEKPITSYCPNPAEWFAEMFRLFVTNAALLDALRPKTYEILNSRWKWVSNPDWAAELGSNIPPRILLNLRKKMR